MVFRTTTGENGAKVITSVFGRFSRSKLSDTVANKYIDEYNRYFLDKSNSLYAEDYISERVDNVDKSLGAYLRNLKGANATLDDYRKYCDKANKSSSSFGIAVKNIGMSLLNLGLNFLVMEVINLAIQGLDKLDNIGRKTLEEVQKEKDDAKEASEKAQSDLDNINSKLQETEDKISELLKKDKLTFVEQQELNNLRDTTAELKLQKQLLEDIAKEKNREELSALYSKFETEQKPSEETKDKNFWENLYNIFVRSSDLENSYMYPDANNEYIYYKFTGRDYYYGDPRIVLAAQAEKDDVIKSGDISADYYEAWEKYVDRSIVEQKAFDTYNELQEKIESGLNVDQTDFNRRDAAEAYLKNRAEYLLNYINNAKELGDTASESYQAWVDEYDKITSKFYPQDAFEAIINRGEYETAKKRLEGLADAGTLTAEKLKELYSSDNDVKTLVDRLKELGLVDLSSTDAWINDLLIKFNASTKVVDENRYTVSSAEDSFKSFKESVSDLATAYSELESNGELSADTVAKLIDKYPDLIECIEFEGDAIRINKQLLVDQLELEKQRRIESIKASRDSAAAALEEAKAKAFLNVVSSTESAKLSQIAEKNFKDGKTDNLTLNYIEELQAIYDRLDAEIKLYESTDISDIAGKGKNDSSSKTDELKEAFEAEYAVINGEKDKLDKGLPWDRSIIADAEDYFNQLEQLNEKYFKNSSDHAEEYAKYQIEVAEGRREIAKSEVEAIKREIESLDKDGGTNSLVKKTELYVKLKQKINDMINAYRDEMAAIGLSDEEINQLDYMKELKDELWSSEDDKIDSVISEYKRWVDAQKDAIEETIKNYEHLINKQKALIDGEKKLYDTQNNIRDIRNEISKELQSNKALSEYLDEDTRKLLFNEDDYNRLSSVLNGISSEVAGINAWYNRQINSLTEDTWYLEEEITAEYERRLAVEEKKYELARNQLDLEKKKLELNNVLNERNIRMLTKNANGEYEWTYVHDAEKAADIVGEISDIESKISDIKTEAAQEASIAEKETISNIYGTINGSLEQRKQDLDDSIDELETAVDQMKSPILEFTDIVEAAAKTMNATIAKYFGGSAINIVTSTQTGNTSSSPIKSETTNAGGDKADRSANMMIDGVKLMNINSAKMVGASDEEIKTLKSMNESIGIDIMKHNSSQWESANTEARKTLESANQIIGEKLGLTYDAASGTWYTDKEKTVRAYADGALLASKGLSLVNDGDGLEMLRTKSGSLVDLKGGETIFNAKQTEFLYKLSKLGALPSYKDSTTQTNYEFNGDIVLKDVQNPDAFINALSKRLKQSSFKNK